MSGIVLSASVRQNLLSLQSTADLLSTTQGRLASGKKVNSALDNPTNFFTAQGLDNRASDISNLLDSIGNGVQILQAANTGITSLQKLVDTAKSIASQVLQTPVGYSTKSNVTSTAITGATATTTKLSALTSAITTADSFTIDGKTISFNSTTGNSVSSAGASLDLSTATVGDLLGAIDTITGATTQSTLGGTTLNQLNDALAANNLQASIDTTGKINIVTTNDAASSTIGAFTGSTATPFAGLAAAAPVADPNSQASRNSLVAQYNEVVNQINTTAQDASFNGVNLLNGDTLKLTFNETGKSTLSITGVSFNLAGLGLSNLTQGTDFLDNSSANKALTALNSASSTLRSEASSLGSNLSVVQIRQDFNKNLINVLQTGSSNLTLADTNEEAANSQALSTRQSIAVSALSLANQSQQSVLQLLR